MHGKIEKSSPITQKNTKSSRITQKINTKSSRVIPIKIKVYIYKSHEQNKYNKLHMFIQDDCYILTLSAFVKLFSTWRLYADA